MTMSANRSVLPSPPPTTNPMFEYNRSASLIVTIFGAITNFGLTVQVLTAWRSLKWAPESEWEASGDRWQVDGVKVIWGLLSAYFAVAATVCVVGFMGIIKSKPSLVRFYRDYSIADFSFCTFVTALTTYAGFHSSARAAICEELSRHPELLRDLVDTGLNLENCERWLERAVLGFVAVMVVLIVIRLHFLLAVSSVYSQLIRSPHLSGHSRSHSRFRHQDSSTLQRIYLLPRRNIDDQTSHDHDVELVYAPVPLNSLPKELRETATEAWVSQGNSRPDLGILSRSASDSSGSEQQERPHRHHRRHSHGHRRTSSRSSSATRTGTICLPISHDEGLLPPSYGDGDSKA